MQNRIRNKKNLPTGRSQNSRQQSAISAEKAAALRQQFFSRHYISSGVSRQ